MPDRGVAQRDRLVAIADILAGIGVFALLAWSLVHADEPQFQGKAMTARLICFPIAVLLVPVLAWLLRGRHGPRPYPHGIGLLVTVPFLVDLLGNAAGWYHDFEHFDDWVHAGSPALFVAAVTLLFATLAVSSWIVWLLAIGVGSTGHILWELIEYWLLVRFRADELGLTLADTLSDLGWGLVGSVVGVAMAVLVAGPRASDVRGPAAAGTPQE
ncbi:MAG: hypothetical protein JWM90_2476 [Thermoleophilia bacterium]|nr:hypothetical protein [Thermoleophilia bacterium]